VNETLPQCALVEGPLKALDLKVLEGPNYFSAGPVIALRLDLGAFDEVFTSDIPGFKERLQNQLPSLESHHCSVGQPGGFFKRVTNGTLLGHVTEHVAIELQTLAGMDVGYGKTRSTATQGVYNVIFRFFDEVVGLYAARAALNLVNALLAEQSSDVQRITDDLLQIREERLLGPSTQAVVDLAEERELPCYRLDRYNLVQLGTGKYQKRIRATISSDTSLLAVETADDKYLANRMLADAGVPVPTTIRATDAAAVEAFRREQDAPLVVKPCTGHHGQGITLGPATEQAVAEAVERALTFDDTVIAQPLVAGASFRLLVIDGSFVAAARMEPPLIIGDGQLTIEQLVTGLNNDPRRGVGDKSALSLVEIDEETERILALNGLAPESVLGAGQTQVLKVSGNLRLGGASHDVTDQVHPMNRMLVERAARTLGLDAAGVDVLAPSLDRSILDTGGVVIEVGAAPDFRPHLNPASGTPRDVAGPFLDMLFPDSKHSRVPVVAVTGTDGKTATVDLLHHCLSGTGYRVGRATSNGLLVGEEVLIPGEMTGFESAAMTLRDPTIDCALLEVPVETILDRGLGYRFADIAVVLNLRDEGLLYDEASIMEDIAYAHAVVAEQVYRDGTTILNADDDLILEMRERLDNTAVLFSRDPQNPALVELLAAGGRGVTIEDGKVTVIDRGEKIGLVEVTEIPLLQGEGPAFRLDVVLAGAVALYCFGASIDRITEALVGFTLDRQG